MWDVTGLDRLRGCGRHAVNLDGAVRVRASGAGQDRRAGFAGLASCGSVWSCPVCSERILAGRQAELATAIERWQAAGGRVELLTLTMRHRAGQRLGHLWDALGYAWHKATSGRPWARLNESYGAPQTRTVTAGARRGETVTENRIRWVRVVETTHGDNGWHVHVHAALFLPGDVSADGLDDLTGTMFSAWSAALVRRGLDGPTRRHGVTLRSGGAGSDALADYFTKGTYSAEPTRLALELARGDLKHARSGNRTPFRILADLGALGLADDLELWREWEMASRGRRQLAWSTGARADLLADVAERSDDELAAEELGGTHDDLVELPAAVARRVLTTPAAAVVLDLAEMDDDGAGLRAYLSSRGWPYLDVRPPERVMQRNVGAA